MNLIFLKSVMHHPAPVGAGICVDEGLGVQTSLYTQLFLGELNKQFG